MKSVILSCPTLKGELLAAIANHNADIPVIFLIHINLIRSMLCSPLHQHRDARGTTRASRDSSAPSGLRARLRMTSFFLQGLRPCTPLASANRAISNFIQIAICCLTI